jgi:hypothetical protein
MEQAIRGDAMNVIHTLARQLTDCLSFVFAPDRNIWDAAPYDSARQRWLEDGPTS